MEIKGFENYLIYEDGRVWNKRGKGRFIKPSKMKAGYYRTCLNKQGKPSYKLIHRLIAQHYIQNPENKPEVDHINRDRGDNRIENLRWATRSDNVDNTIHRSTSKTKIKNVHYNNRVGLTEPYIFQKSKMGERHYKSFKTLEEAIAYNNAFNFDK